jgi:two-component system chemotaxis response regulator CheY
MAKEVLLVDDSDIVRKLIRRIIEPMGYAIREAADGLQAVEQCKTKLPDVILLDFNMPEMDGMETLHEVRKLPGGDAIIIIFCTTMNESSFIMDAISAGANEYVMKPFDAEIIQGKFDQLGITPH